jgi:monooxygenase
MGNSALDALGAGAVTFINRFAVHGSPDDFERAFAATSAFMSQQAGFLGHALLRHHDDDKHNHYVNVAAWRDAACLQAAVSHPDFAPHAAALRQLSTSEPNLYTLRQLRITSDEVTALTPGTGR